MTFGTFLLYFIASELILQSVVLIISFFVLLYNRRKLENEIKKHGLSMLTDDELKEYMDLNVKKRWN